MTGLINKEAISMRLYSTLYQSSRSTLDMVIIIKWSVLTRQPLSEVYSHSYYIYIHTNIVIAMKPSLTPTFIAHIAVVTVLLA